MRERLATAAISGQSPGLGEGRRQCEIHPLTSHLTVDKGQLPTLIDAKALVAECSCMLLAEKHQDQETLMSQMCEMQRRHSEALHDAWWL